VIGYKITNYQVAARKGRLEMAIYSNNPRERGLSHGLQSPTTVLSGRDIYLRVLIIIATFGESRRMSCRTPGIRQAALETREPAITRNAHTRLGGMEPKVIQQRSETHDSYGAGLRILVSRASQRLKLSPQRSKASERSECVALPQHTRPPPSPRPGVVRFGLCLAIILLQPGLLVFLHLGSSTLLRRISVSLMV
jgi:hypothetical protein